MSSKHYRDQGKNARAALLLTFNKRSQDSSSLLSMVQPLLDDNKVNISDTTNIEGESNTMY